VKVWARYEAILQRLGRGFGVLDSGCWIWNAGFEVWRGEDHSVDWAGFRCWDPTTLGGRVLYVGVLWLIELASGIMI
jgi:hypothetical protein